VVLPALAQKLVDDADLPIHSAALMNPTPDSITTSLTASLKVPLGLTVNLDATDLMLYNPKTEPFTPYITVSLPAQKLKGNTTISVVDQVVKIENMSEFLGFLKDAVYAEEFTLYARGKSTAHIGKLKASVKFNKGVKMKGMLHETYLYFLF
jgi:predicted transcriptional regulator